MGPKPAIYDTVAVLVLRLFFPSHKRNFDTSDNDFLSKQSLTIFSLLTNALLL